METNNITAPATTDNFSWQRVGMVADYYYPMLRRQIILYPAISAAIGIATFFMYNSPVSTVFAGLLSLIITFMLYFGPTIFTRRSDRAMETLLPATYTEKSTFILLYTFIGIPLLAQGPYYLCQYILTLFVPTNDFFMQMTDLSNKVISKTFGLNFMQTLVPLATCLYVVMRVKNNRAILGMVWGIVSTVGISIIGAIYGVILAFRTDMFKGIADGIKADTATYQSGHELGEQIAEQMTDYMLPFLYVMGAMCLVYVVIMAWLTVRTIRKGQY